MNKSKTSYDNTKCTSSRIGRSFAVFELLLSSSVGHWAPLPLRLIVGYGFAEHGFAKLSRGPDNFTGILHAMGLPLPHVFAWITIVTEIVGGLCILWGACSGSQHSDGYRVAGRYLHRPPAVRIPVDKA